MDLLQLLLKHFDVTYMSDIMWSISRTIAMYISPILMIVAMYIRLLETQLGALVGSGKYGVAIRDALLLSFLLGVYFTLGGLIVDFMNPFYAWLDKIGSLKTATDAFKEYTVYIKSQTKSQNLLEDIVGLGAAPYTAVCSLFFYGTLIGVTFITMFLKIALVMVFGIAFMWGLIAIPISISTTFKILKGWVLLYAFSLTWPIIQGLLLALFVGLFIKSVNAMIADPANSNAQLLAGDIMLVFSVLHLLMIAVMIAAPFIAVSLITNSMAAGGIVMPFVAAAMAAGSLTAKAIQNKGGGALVNAFKPAGGVNNSSTNTRVGQGPTPRVAPQTPQPSARTKKSAIPGSGINNNSSTEAKASTVSAPPPQSGVPDTAQKKAQQRRRGVLIRQQSKKPG